MFYLEKLAFISLSATGVAIIIIVHYLLSKPASTINTSPARVNKPNDAIINPITTKRRRTATDNNRSSPTDAQHIADVGDDDHGTPNHHHANDTFLSKRTVVRASMSYRPRGVLARAVYEKVHNDQYLDGYDMQLVSLCGSGGIISAHLRTEREMRDSPFVCRNDVREK